MTNPQEFSSDFDLWVCSFLDMLRAKGYTNVSVNRGSANYAFLYHKPINVTFVTNYTRIGSCVVIQYFQLQTDFLNKQTPQQILDLLNNYEM